MTHDILLDRYAQARGQDRPQHPARPAAADHRAARCRAAGPPHHRACLQGGRDAGHPLYADDETTLARYRHAHPDEAFDVAPGWLFNGMAEAFKGGAARLAVAGEDPTLLSARTRRRCARQQGAQHRLSPGAGAHHRLRHQLEPGARRDAWLGASGVSRACPRTRPWPALGCDLRRLPGGPRRPGRRMGAHNATCMRRTAFLNGKDYAR
jgi:aminopeptidase